MKQHKKPIGVDLFAGAGGMSLGAKMAGIEVALAVENDPHAAATYAHNNPETKLITNSVERIRKIDVSSHGRPTVLFGGPPCQGFSTSNQKTRNSKNPSNWLFKEFFRIARIWTPDWIVFENVRGIVETEKGFFRKLIITELQDMGYTCSHGVLCSTGYGVPQVRSRFFLIGSRHGIQVKMPLPAEETTVTVRQAISDLPVLTNGANQDYLIYPRKPKSKYAREMRNGNVGCNGHVVTKNAPWVIERYKYIPQGGNWKDIPAKLMNNYSDRSRCHTGIYRRLRENRPAIVLGNYRKNMLIHPWENRGLSVREAARLQSFPDWYEFCGSIGFQQQQVANAVPPLLAKAVLQALLKSEK